jgi:hypothetical protein
MKKAWIGLAAASAMALAGSMAQAGSVQATDWNKDGTFAKTGASAVFYDQANGLLWSNTSIDLGTARTFEQASSLLAGYNASGSIEGVRNWMLPTVEQFQLLYATQGPDTVTNNGMEKRVFDGLRTYVWTNTVSVSSVGHHDGFGANFALGAPGQFNAFADSQRLAVWAVAAVPEPETYAMLLSGLASVAWIARRRKAPTALAAPTAQ